MGSDGRRHSTQRQLDGGGKRCQRRPQRCIQRDDSLQALCQRHLCSRRQVQIFSQRVRQIQRRGRQRQEGEQRKRSMQEVAMTLAPSSSSEAAPPGLSVSVNNSANSKSVAALAAVLSDVLSPVGSPDSGRAAGLAALAQICWVCSSTEIPCVRCT